jgi:hypothetical protein
MVQLLCFLIYIYYIELLSLALEGSCISCTTSRRIDIASGLNRSQSEARFNSARGYSCPSPRAESVSRRVLKIHPPPYPRAGSHVDGTFLGMRTEEFGEIRIEGR